MDASATDVCMFDGLGKITTPMDATRKLDFLRSLYL